MGGLLRSMSILNEKLRYHHLSRAKGPLLRNGCCHCTSLNLPISNRTTFVSSHNHAISSSLGIFIHIPNSYLTLSSSLLSTSHSHIHVLSTSHSPIQSSKFLLPPLPISTRLHLSQTFLSNPISFTSLPFRILLYFTRKQRKFVRWEKHDHAESFSQVDTTRIMKEGEILLSLGCWPAVK